MQRVAQWCTHRASYPHAQAWRALSEHVCSADLHRDALELTLVLEQLADLSFAAMWRFVQPVDDVARECLNREWCRAVRVEAQEVCEKLTESTRGSARGAPSRLHRAGCGGAHVRVGGASDWSIRAAGSDRLSGQRTASGVRDDVLLKIRGMVVEK